MVLDKMNEKKCHYELVNTGYHTSVIWLKSKGFEWILRKKGKDLNLYDQSEELIKLVCEVLK